MFKLKSKINRTLMIFSILAVAFCFISGNAYAQMPQQPQQQEVRTDFTDDELGKFVEAAQKVMAIQQQINHDVTEGIESEGLTVEQFQNMFNAMQDPQRELDATEEEQQAFDRAMQKVNDVQQEADTKVMQAVEDAGLSNQEYEEIMTAYQQDPEVQQRVNALLQ